MAQLQGFLARSELSAPEAEHSAAAHLARLMTLWPGTEYGALQPEDLGLLWRLARSQGARRLVLEVADEDGARVTVRVLDREETPAEVPPNLQLRQDARHYLDA